MKLLRYPFYGVLAGLLPFLAVWNLNKTQIRPRDVGNSLLVTCAFVLVVWLVFLLLTRSSGRAAVQSALFFVFFFSYGHVYNMLEGQKLLGVEIGFVKLLVVYAVLYLAAAILLWRRTSPVPGTVSMLNAFTLALCLLLLLQVGVFQLKKGAKPAAAPSVPADQAPAAGAELPDIYYIILDAYPRQDVLADEMNFDNSGFIAALRERGFYVADCANSNYDDTVSSVTSSLNYAYLQNPDGKNAALSLFNNRVRNDLAQLGYQFVATKGYSSFNDIDDADIYLNYLTDSGFKDTVARSQFIAMFAETTLLRALFEHYYMNPVKNDFLPYWFFTGRVEDSVLGYASLWYNQTVYVFDQLEELPGRAGNYFVYAHINAPHGPYVFDREGNFRYTNNPEDNLPYYTDTVVYLNKRVLELVDVLISESAPPPVIILQGDHGAHVLTSGADKHKILSAYLLPADAEADLYPAITPVNTFRVVLRHLFGAELELLPDMVYLRNGEELTPVESACEIN